MAGNIKGITIEIGGDTTKLSKALKDVNKQSSDVSKQLREIDKSMKFNPKSTELLAQKQRALASAVTNTKEKLEKLKIAQEQAKKALSEGKIGQDEYDALTREIMKTENQLKSFEKQLEQTNSKAAQFGKSMQDFGGKAENLGKKLLPASAAVGALGVGVIKTAGDFEAGMSEVKAISGATGEDMVKLSEKAREMGEKTKFSASESAEALSYMAMAGWKTEQMLDGLEGIMNLAAASGEELGTTSDIVTDALSAFGLQASDSSHFADVLAVASSNANTNVGMLGESFKYVAPIAGAMGYTAEDTALALGLMANNGIKAGQAGTTLKNAIGSMAKPTKEAEQLMQDLGINMFDAHGNALPLREVLVQLREGFGGMSEEGAAAAAQILFGKESMAGMLAVINTSDKDFNNYIDHLDNVDGAAKKMADEMNNNLPGQITLLKSGIESLAITIGNIMLPAIKGVVSGIQSFVEFLNSAPAPVQAFVVTILAIVAAIGPALILIGRMSTGIGALITFFSAGGAGAGAFSAIIGALHGPIGIAIAAITAFIAVGVLLYKNWDWVKAKASEVWGGIKDFFSTIWEGVSTSWQETWDSITTWLTEKWTSFIATVQPIWDGLVNIFTFIWELIKEVFNVAWLAISTPLILAWQVLIATAQAIWEPLSQMFQAIWETIKTVTSQVWETIKSELSTVWNAISSLAKSVFDPIKEFFSQVWTAIKTKTEEVWNAIKTSLGAIWDSIKTFATEKFNAIKDAVSQVWDALKTKTEAIWNGVKTSLGSIWDSIKSAASEKFNAVKTVVTQVWDSIKSAATEKWNAIKSAMLKPIESAASAIKGQLDKISGFFKSMHFQFPKIKLPHFSISGSLSINPPSVPHLSVDWYDKGGIFSSPSVIGVGEKRPEFVGALDDLRYLIGSELDKRSSSKAGNTIVIENMVVRSDDDIKKIAKELDRLQRQNNRGRGLVMG